MEKRIVLAEGESTGHAHIAIGEDLEFNAGVLSAPKGARVVHEEHKEIVLPPGKFEVGRVQEYDHFTEEAKNVQD